MKHLFSLLLLTFAIGTSTAQAADARWYRYYDDKKQPNVTDNVTPEHITRGYDELTAGMQLIKHVPAQRLLTTQELAAAKAKHDADAQRERDDKQLQRLYSSPADAEHARDRQLEAIQLRVDFSSNSLASLRQRRAAEAQKAAVFERTGKPVPKDTKDGIASYDKQIQSAQSEINARKAEQDKLRTEFAPVIERLKELAAMRASGSVIPASQKP